MPKIKRDPSYKEKTKTVKINESTHDKISSVKEDIKRESKENINLDVAIMAGMLWREATKITENGDVITFHIRFVEFRENMMAFEVGIYPVSKYDDVEYASRMIDPERVVIRDDKIRVLFDYPMSHVVEEAHEKQGGFTRKEVLRIVGEGYKKIYDDEAKTMTSIGESPFRDNRGRSDGDHGIYGHVIGDLWLEGFSFDKKTGILRLCIGS